MMTDDNRLRRLEALAWLLDESIRIPGTRYRIGLDGFIGLVPGIGDLAGAAISSYLVLQAARIGAPASLLARMGLNVATESVIGIVPLAGDLFDFGFKANARNTRLLRRHLSEDGGGRIENRLVVGATAIAIISLLLGTVVLALAVLRWAWQAVSGGA